jgi:hypothetical protein
MDEPLEDHLPDLETFLIRISQGQLHTTISKSDQGGFPPYLISWSKQKSKDFKFSPSFHLIGIASSQNECYGLKSNATGLPGLESNTSGFPGLESNPSGLLELKSNPSGFPGLKSNPNGLLGLKSSQNEFIGLKPSPNGLLGSESTQAEFLLRLESFNGVVIEEKHIQLSTANEKLGDHLPLIHSFLSGDHSFFSNFFFAI